MTKNLREDLPDGAYIVTVYSGGQYSAEKRNGEWFIVDGTGWSEPLPDDITAAEPAGKPASHVYPLLPGLAEHMALVEAYVTAVTDACALPQDADHGPAQQRFSDARAAVKRSYSAAIWAPTDSALAALETVIKSTAREAREGETTDHAEDTAHALIAARIHELEAENARLKAIVAGAVSRGSCAAAREHEVLRLFVGAAYPVSTEINPRGHNWCEPYLDGALAAAREALK